MAKMSIQCRKCGTYGDEDGAKCMNCWSGRIHSTYSTGFDDPYLGSTQRIERKIAERESVCLDCKLDPCFISSRGSYEFLNSETSIQEREMAKPLFDQPETQKFHGHPRFYEMLNDMAELHSRKNHDYSGDDPLSNLKSPEEIGIPAWKGVIVRLMDKWGRLKQFAKTETLEVKSESVIDTLMDNAVYSLLCIILFEEEEITGDEDVKPSYRDISASGNNPGYRKYI